MSSPPPIVATRAFYAEFDDVKGPCVLCEEPAGCLTGDPLGRKIWDCFSDYVITGNVLLNGLAVRVRAGHDAVLCVPAVLQDESRYVRNALLFGLGVAAPGACLPAASGACTSVLKRLALTLQAMEVESAGVQASTRAGSAAAARRERLARLVPAVLLELRGAVLSACDPVAALPPVPGWPCDCAGTRDANVLSLQRPWLRRGVPLRASRLHGGLQERRPPYEVAAWEVPVLLARPRDLLALSAPHGVHAHQRAGDDAWDLAVQQVIPHVDGVRNAKQLARAAHVDLDVVLRSLRVLRHYRCLAVVRLPSVPPA